MKGRVAQWAVILVAALLVGACATTGSAPATSAPAAPRYAEYPTPVIPPDLTVTERLRARHLGAWNRLQAGDLRAASREFSAVLTQMPELYPARTGLGFVHLAEGDFETAYRWFADALAVNDQYLSAWVGQADALLGLGRDAEAIVAMERVLAIDPQRELLRTRLQLVRFRLTQTSIEAGQRLRREGRYDEAVPHFEQALAQSPESAAILTELARTHQAAGRLDEAEQYARRTVRAEPQASNYVLLAEILEAREQYSEAADLLAQADRLEPSAAWRSRSLALREKAELAALPAEFGRVATAETVTRGDVAAFIGIRLPELVEGAPARATGVATDIREHWAAPWIVPVTRAGIMTVFPNHTFQPAATVRREDLATIAAALIRLVGASRPAELAKWEAARPQFADLPPAHVFYPAAALATTLQVMAPDASGRFDPMRPVTGRELEGAVRRIADLMAR